MHDSRMEAEYCLILQAECQADPKKQFMWHPNYELIVNRRLVCKHRPDFLVWTIVGQGFEDQEIREVKGKLSITGAASRDWIVRAKLFVALHPTIKYFVLTKKGKFWSKKKIDTIEQ